MAKQRSHANPARQRAATKALASRSPTSITMASINELRRTQGQVRLGRASARPSAHTGEFGASGTLNMMGRIYNEDYNALFDGKAGVAIYDQMYRSDGTLGAANDIITFPIRAANWRAVPPEKNPTPKEIELADKINDHFFDHDWPPGESWDFYLRHLLMRVSMGFGLCELVWIFDEDEGVMRWSRLAPRLPKTVDKFIPNPDGTLKDIIQYVAAPGTAQFDYRTIPYDRYAVLSVREREGDNYFGKSVYRRVYKHWFYKDDAYRIDGIRIDRFGVGIPVAKIEEGHILEADELDEIEQTLMAMRSHHRAYIIEPPKVSFRIMTPDGGRGGAEGTMESIEHHDSAILRGVMATFMGDHAEGLNTNRTATLADIFLHALRAEARSVSGDVRSQVFRPFCYFNYDMSDGTRVPECQVSGIGDMTPEQLSTALAPLVTAGIVTADDPLEDVIRKIFQFPSLSVGWRRGDAKPAPPVVPPPGVPGEDDPAPGDPGKNAPGDPDEPEEVPTTEDEPAGKDLSAVAVTLNSIALQLAELRSRKTKRPKRPKAPEPTRTTRTIVRDDKGKVSGIIEKKEP